MTNNICTYIRTATTDEKAVEAQRVQLNEYVAELSEGDMTTTFTEFVDKGYSGLSQERPALEGIKLLATTGQVNMLVTTDSVRLDRNVTKVNELIKYFDELGVQVEFTNNTALLLEEGEESTSKFIKNLQTELVKYDTKLRSERIKAGIKGKKEAGNNNN